MKKKNRWMDGCFEQELWFFAFYFNLEGYLQDDGYNLDFFARIDGNN
jgi:hypothetical protein